MTNPLELVKRHYLNEIPPSQRPLNLDFSDLFETDGERITRHRIYYDQVQFMSQLGLVQ